MQNLIISNVWLIPCYPLLGVILASPWSLGWSGPLGSRPAGYINILVAGIAFIHSREIPEVLDKWLVSNQNGDV
jgi:NAD(P)H-quinone oxidoreductase subunit 5